MQDLFVLYIYIYFMVQERVSCYVCHLFVVGDNICIRMVMGSLSLNVPYMDLPCIEVLCKAEILSLYLCVNIS